MIASLGEASLITALLLSAIAGISPIAKILPTRITTQTTAHYCTIGAFACVLLAFLLLVTAYVTSDFSLLNVVNNSHTSKPLIYKISGTWGNHEGSMLLWALVLCTYSAAFAIFSNGLPKSKTIILIVQSWITLGFLGFILFTSNPFDTIFPIPKEGRGLNPLLQDIGLAIHPPMLYFGYVGFSIAFSAAIAALVTHESDKKWAQMVRPWVLTAWAFLTFGIGLGAWWAYHELGWGGYWFWDPVENASLMPWLIGTALLHSLVVYEKRETLKRWTVMLAILSFALSLIGTFLVRSGVLTSVHAFANDPERGMYILFALTLLIGISLTLFAIHAHKLKPKHSFHEVSKESSIIINNIFLTVACATVLLGTLYPLFMELTGNAKVTVGVPYFNATFNPIVIPLVLLAVIGPITNWKQDQWKNIQKHLPYPLLLASAATITIWILSSTTISTLSLVGIFCGIWLLTGMLNQFIKRIKLGSVPLKQSFVKATHVPRSFYSMLVAHCGVACLVIGLSVATEWNNEIQQVMRPGDKTTLSGYEFIFKGIDAFKGPNFIATSGTFDVFRDGNAITSLTPEVRLYPVEGTQTTEAGIYRIGMNDLYAVIGDSDGKDGYAVRLYFKPFIHWIWLGAFFIGLGGFIAIQHNKQQGANAA